MQTLMSLQADLESALVYDDLDTPLPLEAE
jgi:hypothetical protein